MRWVSRGTGASPPQGGFFRTEVGAATTRSSSWSRSGPASDLEAQRTVEGRRQPRLAVVVVVATEERGGGRAARQRSIEFGLREPPNDKSGSSG